MADGLNIMAKFRTRLSELMEKRGMTRMDVVRQADISYPTVSAWETEKLDSVAADKVEALMRLFGLTKIDDLIYTVDHEADPEN